MCFVLIGFGVLHFYLTQLQLLLIPCGFIRLHGNFNQPQLFLTKPGFLASPCLMSLVCQQHSFSYSLRPNISFQYIETTLSIISSGLNLGNLTDFFKMYSYNS